MLDLQKVNFAFGAAPVLHDVSLRVAPGEIVALLGPSGCGKSSLLRLAAGMLRPASGHIADRSVRRALVFQEPRLAPWIDAVDNAAFGLKATGVARHERRACARLWLRQVGLEETDFVKRPAALSGGMRQRVALARALAIRPQLLLMDEPFVALDVGLRRRLQDAVMRETRQAGVATLFVTHDVIEAVRIADRIIILSARPARIVANVVNRTPDDPAAHYEAAAALLRRPAIAAALLAQTSPSGDAARQLRSQDRTPPCTE